MLIRTVAETGSTNADLLAMAADAPDGVWLVAGRQTAGRGRQGRTWVSPPGNLYASTLIRLRPDDPPAATLALTAGVALDEAVSAWTSGTAVPLQLKWPNDLLLGGAKLAGILLERAGNAVVAGFGINLAHHPDLVDRPATSLAAHGIIVTPAAFVEVLAEAFARWLARWREAIAPIRQRWLARAHVAGAALSVRVPDGTPLEGLFDGLDPQGALRLRLASGETRVIQAADVFLL